MKKPKTETKQKEATTCQRKRVQQDTAAMGCWQERSINSGLYTLDNSPERQYFQTSASLNMER
jgi:hypothetical protein